MSSDDSPQPLKRSEKLQLLTSPLVVEASSDTIPLNDNAAPDLHLFGDRYGPQHDCPQFQKHEDASNLELFFDLFFAANYTVFSQTQGVNSHEKFKAYVGYFSVLWMTWLIVGLYDVRFVTDSMFERACRGVQLGVMVGFAVVAPNFNPAQQNIKTMRTMSIILAISRLCLSVEYSSILWHIRAYKKQRLPMLIQIGVAFFASMVYLGTTFRFRDHNSNVFIIWYVMAGVELFLTFAIANKWPVLSFEGTHLMKRMGLLTIIILGDGIIVVAQNVVTMVKSPDAWNSETIGIVTAATTTIYFIFLIYFDWMRNPQLPHIRQQFWSALHYPLHLALVLFMQGFTQFILWTKIIGTIDDLKFDSILNNIDAIARATTKDIYDNLFDITANFFKLYPPKYYITWQAVDAALVSISTLPDKFWPELATYLKDGDDSVFTSMDNFTGFGDAFFTITYSMENALLEAYNIDLLESVLEEGGNSTANATSSEINSQVNIETWKRFRLVFAYAYITAGITLILMTVLAIISRTTPWKKWSIIRTVIFFFLGLGMGLVALLHFSPDNAAKFQSTPWMIPTICLVWVLVLFLTHIRNPPPLFFRGNQALFSKSKAREPESIPMNTRSTQYKPVNEPEPGHRHRHDSYYGQAGYNEPGYSHSDYSRPLSSHAPYTPTAYDPTSYNG